MPFVFARAFFIAVMVGSEHIGIRLLPITFWSHVSLTRRLTYCTAGSPTSNVLTTAPPTVIDCLISGIGSTCSVSYVPTAPGEYTIIIKFADKPISGAPFTAKIAGPRELFV